MEAQAQQQQPQPSGAGKEEILGKKKKKKQQLVVKKTKLKQEVIDVILKEPFEPLGDDEVLMGGMSEPYRDCHAKARAALEALAEFDADIIRQYQAKGYAEVDVVGTTTTRVRAGSIQYTYYSVYDTDRSDTTADDLFMKYYVMNNLTIFYWLV
jgi:hypothetical protein